MFKVTDAAKAFMAEELDRLEHPAKVIRFFHDPDGLHLRLSKALPGDQDFNHGSRTVFVVDGDLAERLDGRTLDVKDTESGKKLRLADGERVDT